MTSKVTVQAHNGGRVRVTIVDPAASDKELSSQILEPSTSTDFYIHSNAKVIAEEIPNTDPQAQGARGGEKIG